MGRGAVARGGPGEIAWIPLPCPATQPRLSACFRRVAGTDETKETSGPHEGSKGRHRPEARGEQDRHGIDEGAGLAPDSAHQRPDRSSSDAPEGPLLTARPAQACRPASPFSHLSPEARPGGIQSTDQGTGAAQGVLTTYAQASSLARDKSERRVEIRAS